MEQRTITYDDAIVRRFIVASVVFGVVGMLVGVLIATQLTFWQANFGVPWLTFSRLRPLHTNAVIFAFVGNMMFAGVYYSTQRLLQGAHGVGSALAASTSGAGSSSSSPPRSRCRSASPTARNTPSSTGRSTSPSRVIWVVFAINFFWTLAKRNEKHLYVAHLVLHRDHRHRGDALHRQHLSTPGSR